MERMAARWGVGAPWQVVVLLLVSVPVLAQDSLSQVPLGCFNYGYKYEPALKNVSGMPFKKDSPLECQRLCQQTTGCGVFAYWVHNRECWLGGPYAKLEESPTAGSIAGPVYCMQESPSCAAIPGPAFPGGTPDESRVAWPMEQQPTNLQCWPRLNNGYPARCLHQPAMVLEDTLDGWMGRCDGLVKITSLAPGETCQLRCMQSPLCAVWSIENVTSRDGSPTCWQGTVGTNCYSGKAGLPAMRAQRILHGSFRVLMNTMGMQILNLTQAFDTSNYPNWQDGARKCRLTCLSYLLCQHWQYSDKFGCWIEDVTKKPVGYPLLNHFPDLVTDTDIADSVKAGEYIQHICKPGPAVPVPTDLPAGFGWASGKEGVVVQPPAGAPKLPSSMDSGRPVPIMVDDKQGSFPWWGSLLVGLAVLICVAAVVAAIVLTMLDMKKGDRKGRAGGGFGGPERDSWHSGVSGHSDTASFLHGNHITHDPYQGGGHGWHWPTRPWLGSTYHNLHPQQPPTQHLPPTTPSRAPGSFWG